MPHPADDALTGAVGEVIRSLKAGGWTTRAIADQFQVSDPTVIRWENGDRAPRLDQLPTLDALAGLPPGHILRLAGYVSDEVDVIAAIAADDSIDEDSKGFLVHAYQFCQKVAAEPPHLVAEPTDAELAAIVPDMDDAGEAKIWRLRRLTDAQKRYELWLLRQRRARAAEQDKPKRQAKGRAAS